MFFRSTVTVLLLTLQLKSTFCYPNYRDRIPNGRNIPHPCKPEETWEGVGHYLAQGTGDRNSFGDDFAAAERQWTRDLCQKDSDGDGLTNGQELGDPGCSWREGETPQVTDRLQLSHPGICNPWDSPACFEKTVDHPRFSTQELWMKDACKSGEFVCPGIDQSDVIQRQIPLQSFTVPSKETIYMCQIFDLNVADQDLHMIATKPIIENRDILHHIVLFGCEDDEVATDKPYECGMAASTKCDSFLSIWTVGLSGECYNSNTGIRLGRNGFKKVAIQLHLNNPDIEVGLSDSSGMTLYITPTLRQYDAAILFLGSAQFSLPPKKDEVIINSKCGKGCTSSKLNDTAYITSAWNHMHYAGKSMNIKIYRNNQMIKELTNDRVYSYDAPHVYIEEPPFPLLPGDEIRTQCIFDTSDREETTFMGDATMEEMCFGFVTVYPKQNFKDLSCIDVYEVNFCDTDSFKGCPNPFSFGSEAELKTTQVYQDVQAKCQYLFPCTKECQDTLDQHFATNPCMKGNVWQFIQVALAQSGNNALYEFYGRVKSCSEVRTEYSTCDINQDTMGIPAASSRSAASFTLFGILSLILVICN